MSKTLADIARMSGYSTATISRVINNQGQVSLETRDAILRALKAHAFVPRKYKRAQAEPPAQPAAGPIEVLLYTQTPSERVSREGDAIVFESLKPVAPSEFFSHANRLSNSFYLRILDGIVEEALRWKQRTVVTPVSDLLDAAFLADLNQPGNAGAILLGTYDDSMAAFAARCARPLVFADLVLEDGPFAVTFDNALGMAQAVGHLYALGHRRMGMAAGPMHMTGFRERLAGFRAETAAHGCVARPEWIYTGSNHVEHVAAWAAEFLRGADRPTALCCGNDFIALGVLRAAARLGLRVPRDLSLVGYDDSELAAIADTPLTTVQAPTVELGRCCVRQLMLQGKVGRAHTPSGSTLRLKPMLVARASTAAPPDA
ncbi:MAG: LacI family DNA-binding transcriptional regulator [Planctomycetota bacterium]|nr:LacI family DNA-binding transcriptional regulator [Planctomycetota bacterium]